MLTVFQLLAVVLLALPPPSLDEEADPADKAYANAQQAFDAGDCATAMTAFAEAFKLRPLPRALLNIAQCQRKQGDLDAASRSYSMIITLYGNSPAAQRARDLLAAVEEERRSGKPLEPNGQPVPSAALGQALRSAGNGNGNGSKSIPDIPVALTVASDIESIDTDLLVARDDALSADAHGREAPAVAAAAWKHVAAFGGKNPWKAEAATRAAQWQAFGNSEHARLARIMTLASVPPQQKAQLLSAYCKKNGDAETRKMLEIVASESRPAVESQLCTQTCGICSSGMVGAWGGAQELSELVVGLDGYVRGTFAGQRFTVPFEWTHRDRSIRFIANRKSGERCLFNAEMTNPNRLEGTLHCLDSATHDVWNATRRSR